VELTPPDALKPLLPFRVLSTPDRCLVRASGEVDGTRVELYENDYSTTDSDGNSSSCDELVCLLYHPHVRGDAALTRDWPKWSDGAALFKTVFDVLTWLPPFVIIKPFQLIAEARNPDRTVGHDVLDHFYCVRADSDAAAAASITPALREYIVRTRFKGSLELRSGLAIYTCDRARMEAGKLEPVLGHVRGFLQAFTEQSSHPMR
jgi:hypothetical protein